jgi:hypothetical protein
MAKTRTKPRRQRPADRQSTQTPGYIVGELSDYFRHEDIGAPSVNPQPRGGTKSTKPHAPEWPKGADPVQMALVYRRLTHAQRFIGRNIFAVLRARYGTVDPRDKTVGAQANEPEFAAWIDHAESLYSRARDLFLPESGKDRERRRQDAQWERLVGDFEA